MKFLVNILTNILMNFDYSVEFSLTYYLLTVASFRIGVPSILLFKEIKSKVTSFTPSVGVSYFWLHLVKTSIL